MTTSRKLVAFLSARLDEDWRIALAVTAESWGASDQLTQLKWDMLPGVAYRHAKRHDPARTLREIEAKRAILGRCVQQAAKEHDNAMEEDRTWVLWPVLFDLAAVWSDHPDYREEWKP